MATNFMPEIGRNRRHSFLLGTHSTTDTSMEKRMDSLTAQKSCLLSTSYKKFGKLWSTNSGDYGDYLATICAPNVRNRRNAFDS